MGGPALRDSVDPNHHVAAGDSIGDRFPGVLNQRRRGL